MVSSKPEQTKEIIHINFQLPLFPARDLLFLQQMKIKKIKLKKDIHIVPSDDVETEGNALDAIRLWIDSLVGIFQDQVDELVEALQVRKF